MVTGVGESCHLARLCRGASRSAWRRSSSRSRTRRCWTRAEALRPPRPPVRLIATRRCSREGSTAQANSWTALWPRLHRAASPCSSESAIRPRSRIPAAASANFASACSWPGLRRGRAHPSLPLRASWSWVARAKCLVIAPCGIRVRGSLWERSGRIDIDRRQNERVEFVAQQIALWKLRSCNAAVALAPRRSGEASSARPR